jgi:hypothetical protein
VDKCETCNRPLQVSAAAETTGLCDHCREVVVLERTGLANSAFQATVAVEPERRSVRQWFEDLLRTDPDNCQCGACGDWQDQLDRWERHG